MAELASPTPGKITLSANFKMVSSLVTIHENPSLSIAFFTD